jgi:signal transduction histidine kinase
VAPDRFGLLGVSERARLLGGDLIVSSEPGEGTTLDVDVPIERYSTDVSPDGTDII